MKGSSSISETVSGLGRDFLDVPVAGLAGLAVATLAWAAPADDLVRLAGSSAPGIRLVFGALGAVLLFGLVLAFLRQLDGLSAAARQQVKAAPTARRRDRHPDAPTRRPISAALEFGEPQPAQSTANLLPAWLGRASLAQEDIAAGRSINAPAAPGENLPNPGIADDSGLSRSAADQARRDTIFGLLGRLEKDYSGPERDEPAFRGPAGESDPSAVPGSTDRLQSAIHSLQRLASRRA